MERFLRQVDQRPVSATDEPRCHNCVYFAERKASEPKSNVWGECRRRSPLPIYNGQFPAVEKNDFCGEWHDGRIDA